MNDFLSDYLLYHSYYEVPRNFAIWSGIAALGAVVNRKVYFYHGDIKIHSNVYVMLIGPPGKGKSVCCDFACRFFEQACPDYETGASTQSAEDIVMNMAKDDFVRAYTDETGELKEVRPYAFFISEFKDFIAYAPSRMLPFLTNIYDRDESFRASTIKRGLENIVNPSVNILACENPEILVNYIKGDIVSGGFSRRCIYCYETESPEPKAFIELDCIALHAKQRIIKRMSQARSTVGRFQWTEAGKKFYKPWYEAKQKMTYPNALMAGYMSTKHVQLFKTCMLLDAVSDKPMLVFTDELLQLGLLLLDLVEVNMPKLTIAAGRNELAMPQHRLLELIASNQGHVVEKRLLAETDNDLGPDEGLRVLRHLENTERIVRVPMKRNGVTKVEIWLIDHFRKAAAQGNVKKEGNEYVWKPTV